MLIGKLHYVHTFGDFWVNDEVKSQYASYLDEEEWEVRRIVWSETTSLVGVDSIAYECKHCKSAALNCNGLVEYLTSLLGRDPELLLVDFQEGEGSHGHEVVLKLERLLVLDFLNELLF